MGPVTLLWRSIRSMHSMASSGKKSHRRAFIDLSVWARCADVNLILRRSKLPPEPNGVGNAVNRILHGGRGEESKVGWTTSKGICRRWGMGADERDGRGLIRTADLIPAIVLAGGSSQALLGNTRNRDINASVRDDMGKPSAVSCEL